MLKPKLNNFSEAKYVCISFRNESEIYSLAKYKIPCIPGEWGYNYLYCSATIYKFFYEWPFCCLPIYSPAHLPAAWCDKQC